MRLDVTWEPLPLSLEGERLICQAVFPSYEARISESARISGVSGQNMFSAPCYPLLRFDIILSRKGSTKRIQKGTEIQTVVFSHYFFSFRRDGYLYARFAEVKSEGKKVDWLFGWSVSCFSVFSGLPLWAWESRSSSLKTTSFCEMNPCTCVCQELLKNKSHELHYIVTCISKLSINWCRPVVMMWGLRLRK